MGSPPGIGPAKSDDAEAHGPAQAVCQAKAHGAPRLVANSSGLDFGMPLGLWRFGKTTVFLNPGSPPAQRPCAGPEYPFKETRFDLLLGDG